MNSYVIITQNMNLIKCSVSPESLLHSEAGVKSEKKLKTDVVISTSDEKFALLALMEGATVYESCTKGSLIPKCKTKSELLERLAENFLEVLEIDKTEKGYEYLKYMIKRHAEDLDYNSEYMITVVYPECAKFFGVSPKTVSKHANLTLRNSFEQNTLRHIALYGEMTGRNVNEAPRVGWFLVCAGQKIRDIANR